MQVARGFVFSLVGVFQNHIMFVPFNDMAALQKNTHSHVKISSSILKEAFLFKTIITICTRVKVKFTKKNNNSNILNRSNSRGKVESQN